ncbi:hypothetical protein DM75_4142 [Burkholderia mallei]|nr:hypothetical protein DM75_4142 [Burkholderia mallei]
MTHVGAARLRLAIDAKRRRCAGVFSWGPCASGFAALCRTDSAKRGCRRVAAHRTGDRASAASCRAPCPCSVLRAPCSVLRAPCSAASMQAHAGHVCPHAPHRPLHRPPAEQPCAIAPNDQACFATPPRRYAQIIISTPATIIGSDSHCPIDRPNVSRPRKSSGSRANSTVKRAAP